jgi:hypothetical protein
MDFNYILFTGDGTISGSSCNPFSKNRKSFLDRNHVTNFLGRFTFLDSEGNPKREPFALDPTIITGRHGSLLSLNSQTLLEEEPKVQVGINQDVFSINTGDYFVNFEFEHGLFHFDKNLPLTETDIAIYDQRDFSTGIAVNKSSPNESFSTSIGNLTQKTHLAYGDSSTVNALFASYDVFFNGQKIYQPDYPSNPVTGKLFSIKKSDFKNEINSELVDVYGSGFIEHQLDLYLNGLEQETSDILQLYTGVYTIETGVETSFTINNPTIESYNI